MDRSNQNNKSNCIQLILGDASKYYNKYVAQPGFNDRRIVAFGDKLDIVAEEARQKGFKEPLVFYVPNPNENYVY